MDQEISRDQMEEDFLIASQDHYFFDMNFMILPNIFDQIRLELNINFEVKSSQEYQENRQSLLCKMLKYEIGLDILIKLVYRRDQSPLNGYYFLKKLDDMAYIIYEIQNKLLDEAIRHEDCQKQISGHIVKLFNSIINRKKKEIKKLPLPDIAQGDLQNLQQKFSRINDINCFLKNYEFYYQNQNGIIECLKSSSQFNLLKKVIVFRNDIGEMSEQQLMKTISDLTIYQQELMITYIQQVLQIQDVELERTQIVIGKYIRLYQAIFLMDMYINEQHNQQEEHYNNIVKLMMLYYFEIENWKLLVIERLMELHQVQDAYELLLASRIDWNCISNSDIIIRLLIASKRSLQAYIYVTELKNDQALKYFVKQMLIQQETYNLLQIEFTPEQDNIVNEIIKNLADIKVLKEFVKKLLRTRKYYQAIEFYQKLQFGPIQFDLENIKELIQKRIAQLPRIEEEYYQQKIDGKQLDQDQLLIESILDNQDKTIEERSQGQRIIKYFADQPIMDQGRFINCCGWIRENHLDMLF